jgi:hypothetical protein
MRLLPFVPVVLLAACGGRAETPAAAADSRAVTAPVEPPSVSITAPLEGDTVRGSSLIVRLQAAGIRIVPASGVQVDGEAHHHLFLDADLTPADSVIPKTAQIHHLGNGADSLVLEGLSPGAHRLIAVLAWGTHVPVPGARTDTVTFIVAP